MSLSYVASNWSLNMPPFSAATIFEATRSENCSRVQNSGTYLPSCFVFVEDMMKPFFPVWNRRCLLVLVGRGGEHHSLPFAVLAVQNQSPRSQDFSTGQSTRSNSPPPKDVKCICECWISAGHILLNCHFMKSRPFYRSANTFLFFQRREVYLWRSNFSRSYFVELPTHEIETSLKVKRCEICEDWM